MHLSLLTLCMMACIGMGYDIGLTLGYKQCVIDSSYYPRIEQVCYCSDKYLAKDMLLKMHSKTFQSKSSKVSGEQYQADGPIDYSWLKDSGSSLY